ncbi:hypothetical protein KY289_032107 [Solanum tuberosum]|nr:hypothetical protein KY289_032107 [Solanum tuberosum]
MSSRYESIELSKEKNVNPNKGIDPQVPKSSKSHKPRARYPYGRMPIMHFCSNRGVVEQENGHRKREIPWLTSHNPINNRLYHPSFAAKGLPMDPYLRMLKENPNFLKIASKSEADSKNKVVMDLNN